MGSVLRMQSPKSFTSFGHEHSLTADSWRLTAQKATSDDYSEVVPPLPIPNRAVKRLSADDSTVYSVRK